MVDYVSTTLPDGAEIDRRLAYVKFLEQVNSQPIGIEWETGSNSPTLKLIDINSNEIIPSASFFDNHVILGHIRRCAVDRTTHEISYGSNARGDGLALDGSMGDIFGEFPTAMCKYQVDGTKRRFWVAPFNSDYPGFSIHPCAPQRSATGTPRSKIYIAAYEMSLRDDNGTLKGASVAGKQPWTGGEIYSLAFTSGSTAFTAGEVLTGATSGAYATVVDYHLTGGSWVGGDAAGVVYLKQKSATAFVSENINGATAGNDCATIGGAASAISLTLDQAEAYANANGGGFGVCNPWSYAYMQLLIYIDTQTLDSQTALGKGIVDLALGTGYVGKITGADSIDSLLGTNGTGTGSGTNGQTPIAWRGIENIYGNVWEFIAGLNMFLSDGTYRVLKRDGTGTPAATLAEGSYETGAGTVPTTDGYISGIQSDEMGALAFIQSQAAGSSSSYLCDTFYYPRYNPSIVRSGGAWSSGRTAGVGCLYANSDPSDSARTFGARLEFLP